MTRRSTTRPRARRLAAVGLALVIAGAGVACSSDTGSQEAFCREVADVPQLATVITGFAETHPDEVEARLDQASAAYDDLRRAAPSEIRGDVDTVLALVEVVITGVRENAEDREAAADRIRDAVADHPDAEAAAAAVVAYATEHCEVSLDPRPEPETTEPQG